MLHTYMPSIDLSSIFFNRLYFAPLLQCFFFCIQVYLNVLDKLVNIYCKERKRY